MSIRKYQPEQMVTVLRQVEVQIANGKTAPPACQEAGIHTPTYYRWRQEYGGMKRLVAELSLAKPGLRDVAPGNCGARSGGVVRWSVRQSHAD